MAAVFETVRKLILAAGWKDWLKAYGLFALLNTVLKVWYKYRKLSRIFWGIRHLKGKNPDFAGTEILANVHRLHDFHSDYIHANPKEELVRAPTPEPEVVCNSARAVETMLKGGFAQVTKPHPSEDYLFQLLSEFLGGEGIFVVRHGESIPEENDSWYFQRKTASRLFTKSNFTHIMYDTLVEKTKHLVQVVQRAAEINDKAGVVDRNSGAVPVDMQEKFFCFTFDSIQRIFFNRELDSIATGSQDPYARAFDDAHREMFFHHFCAIGPVVLTTNVLPFPFGSLLPFYNALNPGMWFFKTFIDTHYREFRRHLKSLEEITYGIIKEVRQDMDNLDERKDLLSFFLRRNPDLTDKQLRDIMLNFIIAGRDTTACALTWLFYQIAVNQDVQEKLAEEVRRCIGKDRMPTLDDLGEMKYLHAVVMETLRLHPPVPFDSKVALAPIRFDCGTVIPEGTRLTFHPYAMGRDTKNYDDPLKFKPERWLDRANPTMFEFPVFQAGPRFCLGKDLAQNEMKLVVALLLQKFKFDLEANERVENISYAIMITMSLVNSKDGKSQSLWLVPTTRD